jgi:hypothetical protein
MKTMRGGMGLGDAVYVAAVARHLAARGERTAVATAWPDVFRRLPVDVVPFRKDRIDILAHYARRKHSRRTQFEDVCDEAGVQGVDLRLDWQCTDASLVARLKREACDRPIALVQLPRAPMGRKDGFGAELLPDCKRIQTAIDMLQGRAMVVQVGAGEALYRFRRIDVDLANETSVCQLLDVAQACDGVLGYVSFILPIAEAFGKRGLMVWSRRGLRASHAYVRQITPQKIIHRKDLISWVFDGQDDDIEGATDVFLRQGARSVSA